VPPTIDLEYKDGLPAWRIRVVQPDRFRGVRYVLQTRLFRLPEGALLAVLLKLYDVPEQPYFVHRVMDLTDPEVVRYVEATWRAGRVLAILDSAGQQEGFQRGLELDGDHWRRCFEEGLAHNGRIQSNGEASLDSFLKVFRPTSQEKGVESAWDEVDKAFNSPPSP